ncbi:SsgA family sporulation/cell division regulator [Kitasatospora sp. NPDC093679]|uniref:SsgA family sporulation/cell division regulator n=1 Tax=Kitasatospora sp. NPDC093679 TaxID=3154983 RepID=UPI003434A1B1
MPALPPAEPYTVYLDNHIDLDAPITWVFARDLLATGLTEWAGTGDVCVHPAAGDRTVFITLTGENSTAVLRVDASHIRTFLAHTERIVPSGTEEGHLDVDRFLRRLRDDEPPEPGPGPEPEPEP